MNKKEFLLSIIKNSGGCADVRCALCIRVSKSLCGLTHQEKIEDCIKLFIKEYGQIELFKELV